MGVWCCWQVCSCSDTEGRHRDHHNPQEIFPHHRLQKQTGTLNNTISVIDDAIIIILYCLAVTPCSLLRPVPPIFGRNYGYFTSITRPPAPPAGHSSRFAVLQFLHIYACCKCRSVVFMYQACRK